MKNIHRPVLYCANFCMPMIPYLGACILGDFCDLDVLYLSYNPYFWQKHLCMKFKHNFYHKCTQRHIILPKKSITQNSITAVTRNSTVKLTIQIQKHRINASSYNQKIRTIVLYWNLLISSLIHQILFRFPCRISITLPFNKGMRTSSPLLMRQYLLNNVARVSIHVS